VLRVAVLVALYVLFWPIPVLHQTLIKEFANWRETTQSGSTDITLKGQERTETCRLVSINVRLIDGHDFRDVIIVSFDIQKHWEIAFLLRLTGGLRNTCQADGQ
jgi:hypothetical protein